MRVLRPRFSLRTLLLLPVVVTVTLLAVDPLTAPPHRWRMSCIEVDAVDAGTKEPIKAKVTRSYFGPLAGQRGSGDSYTTNGVAYGTRRGMMAETSFGYLETIVKRDYGTRIFRRPYRTIAEGTHLRVEADGFEPFEFDLVGQQDWPLTVEGLDLPVIRVELRRQGDAGPAPSWTTRPELRFW